MPESKGRAKAEEKLQNKRARALATKRGENAEEKIRLSGARDWVPYVFVPLGLGGVIWLVVYYIAGSKIPFMLSLGGWNFVIALALIGSAFAVSTQWK
jgi:hypothetical protein